MAQITFLMTDDDVPQTSPATDPQITIYRLDTDVAVVSAASMTSVGGGLWRYNFTPSTTLEYAFLIDADPGGLGQVTTGERYFHGTLSGTDIEHLDQLDTTMSSRSSQTTQDVIDGNVDAILVDTGTTIPAQISGLENLSAAQAADAVWDEARAGHTTAGTYGEFTGDAAMRGTDGANTTVPLAAATGQAEHDSTQAAIAALNDLSSADVTAAVPTAAANADAVWDEPRAGHTTIGTYGEHTGDAAMRGTDGANTTVPLAAATDQAEHDATQAAIAGLNDISASDVDTTLTAAHGAGSWQTGAGADPATIADAVWDEARAGHTTAGTYGEFTGDAAMRGTDGANTTVPMAAATSQTEHDATQAAIGALNDLDATAVAAATQTGLTAQGYTVGRAPGLDNLDATVSSRASSAEIAALNDPTAAAIADAVWDELRADHTTQGSAGQALTLLLNGVMSRTVIDTSATPAWTLNVYTYDEASAGDSVVHEQYELYDQDGAPIAGNATSGNNPLADSTVVVAERRRV